MDTENAQRLGRYILALGRWAEETQIACMEKKDG